MFNELTYRTASVFQGDEILRMSEYMRDKPLKLLLGLRNSLCQKKERLSMMGLSTG
ncbi:hypothetical protein SAMN04487897_1469 [Paenibacillus sp. yr247]|nr:hypothetical protein SAMN04487897_1469 [Paenibacillus sp. yr247]